MTAKVLSSSESGIKYLPSWALAKDPSDTPILRICDEDGTHHHWHLKALAKSGAQYLQAVNFPKKPTAGMLFGTLIHFLILGARTGAKPLIKYDGATRQGNAWKDFVVANPNAEILTASEWAEGEVCAESILRDPVARARLVGARLEVPLVWEESGLKFSTSGVDIVTADDAAGDLKTTTTVEPEAWTRLAFKMHYPHQVALYRRGLRAHGIKCSKGLFILGAETNPPYECVDLNLTEGMIDLADRTVSLWIEKLRAFREAVPEPRHPKDWPGYAQSPIPMDVPSWLQPDDEDEDE